MRILLIISILFLFSAQGQASRLIEIEDYYSKKTTEFVQTRYPKKAFTVYVKVEAEADGEKRQPADVGQRKSLSLPYLNSVNGDQVDFWTRKDLALGTLISYLKSVYVKIDIDGQFSDAEAEQFKSQVFQHLKLSPVYDKVEMSQRVWSQSKEQKQRNLILGVGAVLLCIAFAMLFVVFQSGIRTLVKGIAGPLSDIGKSTENFAKQPMASGGGRSFTPAISASWQEDTLADSKVETIKKQIKEVEDIFQEPNGVLLRSIEDYGGKYPHAMGAIFRELNSENVKSLFRLGTGDWWYKAITQASSLNQKSAQIVTVVSQLKMRMELSQHKESENDDVVMLGLLLSRLDYKMFGQLLKDRKFDESAQILKLIPRDLMIKVSKYLYPGQWAELLEENRDLGELSQDKMKPLITECLEICPLQDEKLVSQYFVEADMNQYLDEAVTKDEREVYRVLPSDHRIKQERFPFYEVFQVDDSVLQTLSIEVPLEEWASVLSHCDQMERERVMKQMTERQFYLLSQLLTQLKSNPSRIEDIVEIKKKIKTSCQYYISHTTTANVETSSEAVA